MKNVYIIFIILLQNIYSYGQSMDDFIHLTNGNGERISQLDPQELERKWEIFKGLYLPLNNNEISAECREDTLTLISNIFNSQTQHSKNKYFQNEYARNKYSRNIILQNQYTNSNEYENNEDLNEEYSEYFEDPYQSDEEFIYNSIKNKGFLPESLWALQMFDSWGKSEDGVLVGNYDFMGMMDECLEAQYIPSMINNSALNSNSSYFEGRYCFFNYMPNYWMFDPNSRIVPIPSLVSWIQFLPKFPGYGTCIPSSCTKEEMTVSVNRTMLSFKPIQSLLIYSYCTSASDHQYYDASNIIGIAILSIFGFLIVSGTIYEYCIQFGLLNEVGGTNALTAFSLKKNIPKIIEVNLHPSKNVISSVHGVRIFSLLWVIWGHQLIFTAFYSAQNTLDVIELSRPLIAQTVFNADKSVDSFFMLSGMFVCVGVLNQMKKTNKFNALQYYLHRFLRLFPPVAVTILLVTTVFPLMTNGPQSEAFNGPFLESCRRNFWIDLLFLSNFVKKILPDEYSCLGHAWYISADMQLYLIMPLLIVPLFYIEEIGKAILSFMTVVSFIIPGALVWAYDLPGSGTQQVSDSTKDQDEIYGMPWCRLQPYLVGVWAGYLLYKYQDKEVKLSKVQVICGWVLASLCGLLVLYGIYPFNNYTTEAITMPLVSTVIFQTFQRGVWTICLSWIVLACHWGYGGFVNGILSYPGFQPISRLSYTMYLVTLVLQQMNGNSVRRQYYLSHFTVVESAIGILPASFVFALLVTLISESPVRNLEKILFSRR